MTQNLLMNEGDIIAQAGLTPEWVDEFIRESNKIDPQAGSSEPGHPLYDWHRDALLYCVRMGIEDRYALPREVHRLLKRDHPRAGVLRTGPAKIGLRALLDPKWVPSFFFHWNQNVFRTIDCLRTDDNSIDPITKHGELWTLHCELLNIRPYEMANGKVARLLLVNHALLVDVAPWIIDCDTGREEYIEAIRRHPSSHWGKLSRSTKPDELLGASWHPRPLERGGIDEFIDAMQPMFAESD